MLDTLFAWGMGSYRARFKISLHSILVVQLPQIKEKYPNSWIEKGTGGAVCSILNTIDRAYKIWANSVKYNGHRAYRI